MAKRATVRAPKVTNEEASDAGSTRTLLLDAAEALFAERGYNGVSTRDIASRAGVNLGSIPYYFGSKETLLKEVLQRRAIPELEDRAAGVRRVLDEAGDKTPDVVAILKADLEPVFRRRRENAVHRRLAGRLATDPSPEVRRIVNEIYSRKATIFDIALRRGCPHLTHDEFYWRFYCLFGAVQYVLADVGKIQTFAGKSFNSSDPEETLRNVIPFLAAGLLAPPRQTET